jgi:hypothetical protein
MPFESIWGFDPERAIHAGDFSQSRLETKDSAYSADEQRAARIPCDMDSQIYELRRMYRL